MNTTSPVHPISTFRFYLVGILFSLLGVLALMQIIRLQTDARAQELPKIGEAFYNYEIRTLFPERGDIFDRWGNLLAGNVEVYEIGVALDEVHYAKSAETIARTLSEILERPGYTEIKVAAETPYEKGKAEFITIADFVPAEKIRQLEQKIQEARDKGSPLNLSGLYWVAHPMRYYPENDLASNILGFVNFLKRPENVAECQRDGDWCGGHLGVEEYYDSLLAGTPIQVRIPKDPRKIDNLPTIPPGSSLILTVDRELQAAVERIADQARESSGAEAVTIIVMNPRNGEILAMTSTPRFNLNRYWEYPDIINIPAFNRAISQVYEPGSVFKVLTMAGGLDSGAVTPEATFLDVGSYTVGGISLHNWEYTVWGAQDMTGCLQHSINTCLAWVANQMGPTRFYQYLEAFGIGRRTGIDIAYEAFYPMRRPGDTDWHEVDLGTNAFGQGISVTPIQMITAISAVANDGKMMAPHIVKAYIRNGQQVEVSPKLMTAPIKPETARTLSEMLANALVNEASPALVDGYRLAGKTGTASIPTEQGYTSPLTNASFVGWGPVDDPQFIVYIWMEKPSASPWASVIAAPVFHDVVEEAVTILRIPPDEVRQQMKEP
ncbi:penicillin-binding protein 2 [Thermanaerothrix sp. 4228-RoL]|uniref:Penicillin-binding protein 2 n=1 Tax=Thermanaerothrix solaris TaxID=3058434 RepID=A0ABU3NT09_9CHLR|nr:penicillin-binding protein 2 [Thermanaerothrix sp. 4228-RoL]MDT8899343.1 penicillin-binding protein 2 [Thermanaerothrix sp. 4228-RoL]